MPTNVFGMPPFMAKAALDAAGFTGEQSQIRHDKAIRTIIFVM